MIKKFITIFEERLNAALEAKTSWGRNDLKLLIKQCLVEALAEVVE